MADKRLTRYAESAAYIGAPRGMEEMRGEERCGAHAGRGEGNCNWKVREGSPALRSARGG